MKRDRIRIAAVASLAMGVVAAAAFLWSMSRTGPLCWPESVGNAIYSDWWDSPRGEPKLCDEESMR
jgi:hypothetical protein